MKTNEKKRDFELIMEAIDAMPAAPCSHKRETDDPDKICVIEDRDALIESLIKDRKFSKRKYLFNGKEINCQENLAKNIFVKYAKETLCTSEEFLHVMQKYNIGQNVVKTEQEVKEIKEKRNQNRIQIEVRDIYPDYNSFETQDGVRMIVSTEFTNKMLTPIINFAKNQGWSVEILSKPLAI